MTRDMVELYLPKFTKEDEVTLVPSACGKPWGCTCTPQAPGCGMTIQEVQRYLIEYYQDKAIHYASLTPEQMMVELGFYTYQK